MNCSKFLGAREDSCFLVIVPLDFVDQLLHTISIANAAPRHRALLIKCNGQALTLLAEREYQGVLAEDRTIETLFLEIEELLLRQLLLLRHFLWGCGNMAHIFMVF